MDDSGSGCFRGCFVEIVALSVASVLLMVWLSTFGASVNLEGVLVNANDSQALLPSHEHGPPQPPSIDPLPALHDLQQPFQTPRSYRSDVQHESTHVTLLRLPSVAPALVHKKDMKSRSEATDAGAMSSHSLQSLSPPSFG